MKPQRSQMKSKPVNYTYNLRERQNQEESISENCVSDPQQTITSQTQHQLTNNTEYNFQEFAQL